MNLRHTTLLVALLFTGSALGQILTDGGGQPIKNGRTNLTKLEIPPVPEIYFIPKPAIPPVDDLSNARAPIPVKHEIQPIPGGATADFGLSTVVWPTEITAQQGISLTTRDGRPLVFRPAFLVLADRVTGTNHLLAEITNAVGQIISDTEVIYPNAFEGEAVTADLRYEYDPDRDSLEQYVTLRRNFAIPEGLDSKNLRLECWTEWLQGEPQEIKRSALTMREADRSVPAVEEENIEINFGSSKIVARGRAFSVGAEDAAIPVRKSWAEIPVPNAESGKEKTVVRRFLIEAIDYLAAKPRLEKLGKAKGQASLRTSPTRSLWASVLPSSRARLGDKTLPMARSQTVALAASGGTETGFVIDFCAQSCIAAPYGLVSWWDAENTQNRYLDVQGVNPGTPYSMTTQSGQIGTALYFNGTGAYVSVADSTSLNFGDSGSFSIEGWINAESAVTSYGVQTIVDKRNTPNDTTATGYALYLIDGCLGFQLGNANLLFQSFQTSSPDLRGAWHHIAVTVNRTAGDGIKFYVDGVNIATMNPTSLTGSINNTQPFLIGKHARSELNAGFKGMIDELSIYNRVLIPADIYALNRANQSGKCGQCIPCGTCATPLTSALVGWWTGDSTPVDRVGSNPMTLQGTATYANSVVGAAFSFDGAGYAYAPASSALDVGPGSGFTIEAWVTPMDIAMQPLFEWYNDPTGAHLWANYTTAGQTPGALFANLVDTSGGSHYLEATYALTVGNATHIALTYDRTSGIGRLFANGNIVKEGNLGSFVPKTAFPFYMGCRPSYYRFNGKIDEPALYNRALSASEVQTIYNAGSNGKCKTPVGTLAQALDQPSWSFTTSGSAAWFYQAATTYDGSDAAQSGAITHNQTTFVETPVSGPSSISFYWKVNSEASYDFLRFFIDGAQQAEISGNVDWNQRSFAIPLGSHTVKWQYSKDPSVNTGADAGWVDLVQIGSVPPPSITAQPQNRVVNQGIQVSFSVGTSGATSFQWFKNGSPISGATSATYTISSPQYADHASYYVQVVNSGGSVNSQNVYLAVVTAQPQCQTRNQNAPASFSVSVASLLPVSYQWRKNGANISGATTSSFNLAAVQPGDAGVYTAQVTAGAATAITSAAQLNVITPPLSQSIAVGDTVTFSVTAFGSPPISYEWRLNGSPIGGATGSSFTIRDAQTANAGSYSVAIVDQCGTAFSPAASLTVTDYRDEDGRSYPYLVLTGTRQNFTLKGSRTYFVDSEVRLTGTTVAEAGTTVKYSLGGRLILDGPVQFKTLPYLPAVFTAKDDETVGASIIGSTGEPSGRYATVALDIMSTSHTEIKHVRVAHAQTAVRYSGSIASEVNDTVRHAQILHCDVAFRGDGNVSAGHARNLKTGNVLMVGVGQAFAGSYFKGTAEHLTLDGCAIFASDSTQSGLQFTVVNSVLANVGNRGQGLTLNGAYNGFYLSANAEFGSPIYRPQAGSPFQTVNYGARYLSDAALFRQRGTPSISSDLLTDLRLRSTWPPTSMPALLDVAIQQSFTPQVQRYVSGAPDLGYYYPAVDYTVATVTARGGAINVAPGTVIAVRGESVTGGYSYWGFQVQENSTFIAHGTPTSPIVFATVRAIQEEPAFIGTIVLSPSFSGVQGTDKPPLVSLRFCNFFLPEYDIHLGAGTISGFSFSENSCMHWSQRDCRFQGGGLHLGPFERERFFPRSLLSWVNNTFDNVDIHLSPDPNLDQMDFGVEVYQNLFRGGDYLMDPVAITGGNWIVKDNIFDTVSLERIIWSTDHDHNAYWQTAPFVPGDNNSGQHDVTLQAAPNYQKGTFGDYYLPATSPSLSAAGSRTPAAAGLFNYTTQTADGTEEGSGHNVAIGPHYVAAVSGWPKDSDANGVADYVEDSNGNGTSDVLESTPPTPIQPVTRVVGDVFQVQQGSAETMLNVLPNDIDSEGMPLTIVYPANPPINTASGILKAASDFMSLAYAPAASFFGSYTFKYAIVNDFNRVISGTSTVLVNKTGNQPPTAALVLVTMGSTASFIDINVSAQISDPEADSLSIHSLGTPSLGTATIIGATQLRYARSVALGGEDSFVYRITDGKGGLAVGTVRVGRDTGGNRPPVAESYSTSTIQNQGQVISLLASDPDGNPLTYTVIQSPQHGTLSGSGNVRTYTATANYCGTDFFTFKVNDGSLDSTPATVTLHVQYGNCEPVASPITMPVPQNAIAHPISLTGWDGDGDRLSFVRDQWEVNPAHGTLSGTPPNLTYTPVSGYTGWDRFTFRVNDGKVDSGPATVAVLVRTPLPGVTRANKDIFEVAQNSAANELDVLANDVDSEERSLTITFRSTPSHGTVDISPDSLALTYTPAVGYFGEDTFTYTVSNGAGRTASESVVVFVTQTGNSPPCANDLSATLLPTEETASFARSTILASCSDPDSGDVLVLHSVDAAKMGTVVYNQSSGTITYTRTAGEYGPDSFPCVVADGRGGHAVLTINIDQLDSDHDGMPDAWETSCGLSTTEVDSLPDSDNDGVPNLLEYTLRTRADAVDNPLTIPLQNGTTLSGFIEIPLTLGGVGTTPPVQLLINGRTAADAHLDRGDDGCWQFNLNTALLPNRRYYIQAAASYQPDKGSDHVETVSGPTVEVTVANAATFERLTSRFGDTLHLNATLASPNATFRVDLFDEFGNGLVYSTGSTVDGSVNLNWNLADGMGAQAVSGNIQAKLSVTSINTSLGNVTSAFVASDGASLAEQTGIDRVRNWFSKETSANAGNTFAVAWGWDRYTSAFNTYTEQMMLNGVINILGNPSAPTCYSLAPSANFPLATAFRFDSKSDKQTLLTALKQSHQFFWLGHGGGGSAISGNPIRADVGPHEVEQALENTAYKANPKHPERVDKHPFRLVIITGCQTYGKRWTDSFGLPFDPAGTKDTVLDYQFTGRVPRAFVGWTKDIIVPFTFLDDIGGQLHAHYSVALAQLFSKWMQGYPLEFCLDAFSEEALSYHMSNGQPYFEAADSWLISGCLDLRR